MYPPAVAERHPDRVAYIMAGSRQTLTYSQLDRASNRLAHAFRQHGMRAGDTVALVLENRIDLPRRDRSRAARPPRCGRRGGRGRARSGVRGRVVAIVEPRQGTGPEALSEKLIGWCRDRLAHFKTPRRVVVTDRLPRRPNGKLSPQDVRALVASGKEEDP